MSKAVAVAFAGFAAMAGSVPAARAVDDAAACAEGIQREPTIAACTRLVESGKLNDEDLALAYSRRGRARLMFAKAADFGPAMADHDTAVGLAPKLASIYVNRALGWNRLGKRDNAATDIEAAIALDPNCAEAYYGRAFIFRYTKDHAEQVMSDYSKAIELKPDYLEAYYEQGTMLFGKDFDRAIANYSKIIELQPDWQNGIAYQARAVAYAGKGDDRLALADRSELVSRRPGVTSYYERGFVYLRLADHDNAVADFKKSLEYGEHPSSRSGLAAAYQAKGDLANALAELNKALAIAPGVVGLYIHRAEIYHAMGRTTEALSEVDAALRPFPRSAGAHLTKGRIYETMGRVDDAIAEFRQVQALMAAPKTSSDRKTLEAGLAGLSRLGATP